MLSFFPRVVFDEILNLIESVSEGFPSYSSEKEKCVINNHIFQNATRFAVSVNEDQKSFLHSVGYLNCTNSHIRLD